MVENKSPASRAFSGLNGFILGIATFSCFFPLWYTLCVSLSAKTAVDAGLVTVWPMGFNFLNYSAITSDAVFYVSFFRSVARVAVGTPFTLIVSIMIAYPLSKSRAEFRARNPLMWLVVFCMVFGGGMVPWYMFMVSYQMTNSFIGLILCGGLPIYYCVLIMNAFKSIPKELEEAAIVDGAGPWRILFTIIIPCSVPTIATIALFVGVNYWNDYFQGMVLSKKADFYPLMTYIRSFSVTVDLNAGLSTEQLIRASQMSNKGLNAAKVFVALIPMLVVYPFVQKYFVKGIMIGAVKG